MINKNGLRLEVCSNTMEIGNSLSEVLLSAQAQGRITCGVYDAIKMLEMNPDGVMFCIFPEIPSDDVTLHIHFTLLEAFCWENNIRVIKVDDVEKISKLLSKTEMTPVNDNDVSSGRISRVGDFNCVLVEYPDTTSEADEDIAEFCKMTIDLYPQPIITLDV